VLDTFRFYSSLRPGIIFLLGSREPYGLKHQRSKVFYCGDLLIGRFSILKLSNRNVACSPICFRFMQWFDTRPKHHTAQFVLLFNFKSNSRFKGDIIFLASVNSLKKRSKSNTTVGSDYLISFSRSLLTVEKIES